MTTNKLNQLDAQKKRGRFKGVVEIRLTKPTKVLLVLAVMSTAIAFASLFFKEVNARVTDIKLYNFQQQGHPGVLYSNSRGNQSIFQFASYTYKVGGKRYKGWGMANQYNGRTVVIKYSTLLPSLSVSSSGLYFLLAFFFFFLAAGARSIVTWARASDYSP